jgi:hypothetical protein
MYIGLLGYILTQRPELFGSASCQHLCRRGYLPYLIATELTVDANDGRFLHCVQREMPGV